MHIIIIGCGRLGSNLARELIDIGHDVSIIERSGEKLSVLFNGFNGQIIKGIEFDNDNLLEAGIKKADAILIVSPDDNINITVALIAKKIYNVPKIIARINIPDRKHIYEKLEIETINPVWLGVEMLKFRLTEQNSDIIAELNKEFEIIELTVFNSNMGSVRDIENKFSCIISEINKNGTVFLPHKEDIVEINDKIVCTVNKKNKKHLISSISKEMFK